MVTVKKLCILLIVFSLMLASVGAMASSSVTDRFDLTAKELKFNPRTNTFAYCKEGSSTYVLINSEGRELTTKPYIYMSPNVTFFEVSVESGVNTIGMIDGDGNEVMPMQYGDVQYLSDRWLMGVDIVVGNTLPDMLLTGALCLLAEKALGSRETTKA